VRCRYVPKAQHALGFPASPRAGLHLVRPGVICEGKSGLNKQKNSPTFRMVNSFGYEARLLRTEAVTTEIGSPRAQIAPRDQWLWSKGLPSPFCSGRRSRLACPSQGCGGGGGIRTGDQGLMSSADRRSPSPTLVRIWLLVAENTRFRTKTSERVPARTTCIGCQDPVNVARRKIISLFIQYRAGSPL